MRNKTKKSNDPPIASLMYQGYFSPRSLSMYGLFVHFAIKRSA